MTETTEETMKTIEHIEVNTRVFFMDANKVCRGQIQRVSINVDAAVTINYMIEPEKAKHWERVDNVNVDSSFVALTREELLAKL
jgi:hypothetical protein